MKINFKLERRHSMLLICFISAVFAVSIVYALNTIDTGFRVFSGTTSTIDLTLHPDAACRECKKVTRTAASDIFVPTKTCAEWNAFKANANATEVTLADCAVGIPTSCPGTPTVEDYNGNVYDTVLITGGAGTQCWTQQNYRATKNSSGADINRICYNNNPLMCIIYGGLYDWNTMMNGSAGCNGTGAAQPACSPPVQGICPMGWHIPSHYEWTILERNVGSNPGAFPFDNFTSGWLGTDEGDNLKTGGSSGFNGLLAGYRDSDGSSFVNKGVNAYFWSSTGVGVNSWARALYSSEAKVNRGGTSRNYGFSVHCIKN